MKNWLQCAALMGICLTTTGSAEAGLIQVGSRAELAGNDTINWGQLPILNSGAVLDSVLGSETPFPPPPDTISTTNGIGVSGIARVRIPGGGTMVFTPLTIDSLGGTPSILLDAPSVGTNVDFGGFFSLFKFEFDQPVFGFGADIFAQSGRIGSGAGTLIIDVRDSDNVYLGGIAVFDNSINAFDGFYGFRTDNAMADIKSVTIESFGGSLFAGTRGRHTMLEVNQLDLVTGESSSAVPEPSSTVLFGLGCILLLVVARRKKQTVAATL